MSKHLMKLRTLKAMLRRRGFTCRPGKGSHSVWTHPERSNIRLVLSGSDGRDAKRYQVARARKGTYSTGGHSHA